MNAAVYRPDLSLRGKLRRRLVRLYRRRRISSAPPRAMLTFTFDDVPSSAATIGAAALEAIGVRASFYVCGGLIGVKTAFGRNASAGDLQRLAAQGHEIGCHTFSHMDCGTRSAEDVARELESNARAFADLGLPKARTFAFPYGDVGRAVKRLAYERFELARGVHRGDIGRGSDLNQAPAIGLDGAQGEASARAAMDRAAYEGRWLILFGHAVQPRADEFAVAPEALGRLAAYARESRFEIVTAREGLERLRGHDVAKG